jgi:hypothetical protein
MKTRKKKIILIIYFCIFVFISGNAFTQKSDKAQKGIVYVPAYSSINHSDLKWEFNLTVTLSIHNIDLKNKIYIETIDYYNTTGSKIQSYIRDTKKILNPLETYTIAIKESDIRGGIGANFIIKWNSQSPVNRPLIETIMISTSGQQGISFTSRGETLSD